MKTTELLIPVWPHHASTSEKLGMGQRYHDFSGSDSLNLSFRARPNGDVYEGADKYRVWSDIMLRIWISVEYGMSVDFLASNVSYANERYVEALLKAMKWANKRIEGMPKLTQENSPFWFMDFCKRLGIKRSIQYIRNSNEDVFTPVEEALAILVQEIATTSSRLRKAA